MDRVIDVEVEEMEIGNETYVIHAKVTFSPIIEEGAIAGYDEGTIEIGEVLRMSTKDIPRELPLNRRARLLLKHSAEIHKAIRDKVEEMTLDAEERRESERR